MPGLPKDVSLELRFGSIASISITRRPFHFVHDQLFHLRVCTNQRSMRLPIDTQARA
mgnify:CR=1 FL=1